jgi:ketosteroid isomerase-like protein
MAPHLWLGPTASQEWYWDILTEGKQQGASDYHIIVNRPRRIDVSGDAAYVVVLASMTFRLKEKSVTQTGATFTVALRKIGQRWRIAAWAWTKGKNA